MAVVSGMSQGLVCILSGHTFSTVPGCRHDLETYRPGLNLDLIMLAVAMGGGGGVLGGIIGYRLRSKRSTRRDIPLCSCGDALAFHDLKAGKCHYESLDYRLDGENFYRSCTCQRYDGPTPLEEFYVPPMMPPGDAQAGR